MKKIKHQLLCILVFTGLYIQSISAQQLELFSNSGSLGSGPNATGPLTATLYSNVGTSTTNTAYTPATTVSVSFSNQQYTTSTYPGLTAGARAMAGDINTLRPYDILMPLGQIGNPQASYFSSAPTANSGNISITDNYGFMLYLDAFYQIGNSLTARNYYGDITLTFNKPVINPVLHFSGIGGGYANSINNQVQGFYTEYELSTPDVTAGYSLTRLSGSTYFALDATNTKVINSNTNNYTYATQVNYTDATIGGSAGSVRVNSNGAGITALTFRMYLRGSGGSAPDAMWANPASSVGRPGEGSILSVSLAQNNLSGNVYNDNDGISDGAIDGNLINGTSVLQSNSTSVPLYANLVQSGVLVASTSVNSSGAYSFTNIAAGVYNVVISTSASSTTPILPIGWLSTGEWDGASIPNHDGIVNGTVAVAIGGSNLTNLNFGINQPPTATTVTAASQVHPGAGNNTGSISSSFGGLDPNSGSVTGVRITSFPTGISAISINGVDYTSVANINAAYPNGIPTNTTGQPNIAIMVKPNAGTTSVTIPFNTIDLAGMISTSEGNVTLPLITLTINGIVYNDGNGMLGGVNGSTMPAGTIVTLYAADGTTVLNSTVTDASGGYSLTTLLSDSYQVAVTPPANYYHVSSTDATPSDGITNVILTTTNATGINFGLNRPPRAGDNGSVGHNAGVAATVTNILINDNDPEGAALTPDSISLIAPAGATNFITDAQGDIIGFQVTGHGTWTLNSNASVTFTPFAGYVGDPTSITYTVRDLAGAASNAARIYVDYINATISGRLYNDNNGTTGGVNGTPMAAGINVTLYAANGTTVLATTTTSVLGAYLFPGLGAGNFVVKVTAPDGFRHVSSTDATGTDGSTNVTIVGVTSQANINFGINEPPTAGQGGIVAMNPEGTTQVTILPNTFSNISPSSDASSGIVTSISFTAFPADVASVFVNGTQYFANNPTDVAAFIALVIPTNASGEPTVSITADPDFNTIGTIVFTFLSIDNAGTRSDNPGTATIIFSTALPVQLSYFTATKQANHALLQWSTATEKNNKGFEIERSTDGNNWTVIGYVPSKSIDGNSNQKLEYTFTDKQPVNGKNSYRLKQLDFDGRFQYSIIQTVTFNQSVQILVYPNPVSHTVIVKGLQGGENISLTNMLGQRIHTVKAVNSTTTINLQEFVAGTYFITVTDNSGKIVYYEKLIKK